MRVFDQEVRQLNLQPVPKASSDWLLLSLRPNNDLETLRLIRPDELMWHMLIG
jgi:hypothetical protein